MNNLDVLLFFPFTFIFGIFGFVVVAVVRFWLLYLLWFDCFDVLAVVVAAAACTGFFGACRCGCCCGWGFVCCCGWVNFGGDKNAGREAVNFNQTPKEKI